MCTISIYPSNHPCIHPSINPSIDLQNLSFHISMYLSTISIHPSTHPSTYLFIHLQYWSSIYLSTTSSHSSIYNICPSFILGLGHISNDMIMRISSVKPVPWLVVNLHHLFSNRAAVNTQSRRSLTSYAISSSLSKAIHLQTGDGDLVLIKEPALLRRCAWSYRSIYGPALIHPSTISIYP